MADKPFHRCAQATPHGDSYGPAITECYGEDQLWVTNDEYSSQVNFCPFCGRAAKTPIDPNYDHEEAERAEAARSVCGRGILREQAAPPAATETFTIGELLAPYYGAPRH